MNQQDIVQLQTIVGTHQDIIEPSTIIKIIGPGGKVGIHKPKKPYVGLIETFANEKEPKNVKEAITIQ